MSIVLETCAWANWETLRKQNVSATMFPSFPGLYFVDVTIVIPLKNMRRGNWQRKVKLMRYLKIKDVWPRSRVLCVYSKKSFHGKLEAIYLK
jgi:hypothetical protein